jgi:hypothetical protein
MRRFIRLFLFVPWCILGQNYGFNKGSKDNDYLMVRNKGITFSVGPTWQFTPKTETFEITDNSGSRGVTTLNPDGRLGFYGEFGMVIFPKWKALVPIKALKKSRLLDYMDFTLGYRHYRGIETVTTEFTNAMGDVTNRFESTGTYSNGFLVGRFDAHTLLYFGKKKIDKVRKQFIDQSLGINVDYNLVRGSTTYEPYTSSYSPVVKELNFYHPLVVQMHYSIGVGIRFNRAWMMIPGVSIPFVSFHEWNGFNARMNWFQSTYWPIQAQIKFIKLFERTPKCGAYGDAEDMQRNKDFNDKN